MKHVVLFSENHRRSARCLKTTKKHVCHCGVIDTQHTAREVFLWLREITIAALKKNHSLKKNTVSWAVPALGIVTNIAIFLIEERTKILYTSCLQRGRKVEIELNIENGHFFQLAVAPLPCKIVSHTRAIRTIYILVFFV